MIDIDAEMGRRGVKSRMLIQVHDELIFEVADGEMQEMTGLVKEYMPKAMDLAVPM
jgi:DNA polymerase-1